MIIVVSGCGSTQREKMLKSHNARIDVTRVYESLETVDVQATELSMLIDQPN